MALSDKQVERLYGMIDKRHPDDTKRKVVERLVDAVIFDATQELLADIELNADEDASVRQQIRWYVWKATVRIAALTSRYKDRGSAL